MGRRWGKTVLGGCICLATAAQGGRVAWVVPTYKNSRALWRFARSSVSWLVKAGIVSFSEAERSIEFRNGGLLGIYSADNEDSVRGEAFHLVVIDEAARLKESAWTDAIQPTLADYGGDAILISTPRGKNWFWQEWVRGQMDGKEIASFQAPSADNPNPRIKRAALLARDRVPERTYRQEWLAEFVEDGGEVFRGVYKAAVAQPQAEPEPGHHYVMGIDLARYVDFTVCVVIDRSVRPVRMVAIDRYNHLDWQFQIGRIKALVERFRVEHVLVDQTGVGDPIVEQLQRELRQKAQP